MKSRVVMKSTWKLMSTFLQLFPSITDFKLRELAFSNLVDHSSAYYSDHDYSPKQVSVSPHKLAPNFR